MDAFIRGLDGDVYKFIRNYEPTSFAEAYSYCISFQNLECRKMLTNPKHFNTPPSAPRNQIPLPIPHLPPRVFLHQQRPMIANNVRPHFAHHPPIQNYAGNFKQRPVWNPPNQQRPIFQRTSFNQPNQMKHFTQLRNNFRQNGPEPMEVDPSIRSHQVNYANRPNSSNIRPMKRQRAFNIETVPRRELEPTSYEDNLYDDDVES